MSEKRGRGKAEGKSGMVQGASILLALALMSGVALATEINRPDLPPPVQVERALAVC